MRQVEHISLQEATAKFKAHNVTSTSVTMGPMSLLGPFKCTKAITKLKLWSLDFKYP